MRMTPSEMLPVMTKLDAVKQNKKESVFVSSLVYSI